MGERVEVITRVERQRRWAMADKLRLVAATQQPGATVASVAREQGVLESLLYGWRSRLARDAPAHPGFASVTVLGEARSPATVSEKSLALPAGTIEIVLPNGGP